MSGCCTAAGAYKAGVSVSALCGGIVFGCCQGQLEYARHVWLGLHCGRRGGVCGASDHQLDSRATLTLKIKIVAVGFIPAKAISRCPSPPSCPSAAEPDSLCVLRVFVGLALFFAAQHDYGCHCCICC